MRRVFSGVGYGGGSVTVVIAVVVVLSSGIPIVQHHARCGPVPVMFKVVIMYCRILM